MAERPTNGMSRIVVEGAWAGAYIYAGGAVDYDDPVRTHMWRHDISDISQFGVYCPICANKDAPDLQTVMSRNTLALIAAERAVFLLDGTFTIGTPIEVHTRLANRPASTVAIIHPDKPGLFVRSWQESGVKVLQSFVGLKEWLT